MWLLLSTVHSLAEVTATVGNSIMRSMLQRSKTQVLWDHTLMHNTALVLPRMQLVFFFFPLTKCWPQLLTLISCEWALTQGANMQGGTWWESCSNTKGTNMVSDLGGEDRLWISSWPLTAYQHWSLIYVNNCSWNTLFCSVLVKPCDSNMGEVGYHSPANL